MKPRCLDTEYMERQVYFHVTMELAHRDARDRVLFVCAWVLTAGYLVLADSLAYVCGVCIDYALDGVLAMVA